MSSRVGWKPLDNDMEEHSYIQKYDMCINIIAYNAIYNVCSHSIVNTYNKCNYVHVWYCGIPTNEENMYHQKLIKIICFLNLISSGDMWIFTTSGVFLAVAVCSEAVYHHLEVSHNHNLRTHYIKHPLVHLPHAKHVLCRSPDSSATFCQTCWPGFQMTFAMIWDLVVDPLLNHRWMNYSIWLTNWWHDLSPTVDGCDIHNKRIVETCSTRSIPGVKLRAVGPGGTGSSNCSIEQFEKQKSENRMWSFLKCWLVS